MHNNLHASLLLVCYTVYMHYTWGYLSYYRIQYFCHWQVMFIFHAVYQSVINNIIHAKQRQVDAECQNMLLTVQDYIYTFAKNFQ